MKNKRASPKSPEKIGGPVKAQTKPQKTLAANKAKAAPPKRPAKVAVLRQKPVLKNQSRENLTSKGISPMRKPVSGKISQDQMHNRLQKKSPWYSSILDPKQNADVKIPDENGCDTGTMQMVKLVTVPISANGVAGVRVCSPYPNLLNTGSALGSNYQVTNPLSTSSSLQWGNGGATMGTMIAFSDTNGTLQACTQGVRIVSACVTGTVETSTLNDSGEGCAFLTPFDVDGIELGAASSAVLYADTANKFGSSTIAINKHKNLVSRWFPTQRTENSDSVIEALDTFDYKAFVDPALTSNTEWVPWEFGVVFVGMTASSGNCKFEIIINYEFIPLLNTMNIIDSAKSPVDPQEEQLVETWLPDLPKTGIISDKQLTVAPSASAVPEPGEGTGFGMFFDVVKEILPIATGVLSML